MNEFQHTDERQNKSKANWKELAVFVLEAVGIGLPSGCAQRSAATRYCVSLISRRDLSLQLMACDSQRRLHYGPLMSNHHLVAGPSTLANRWPI